jgi:glycine cleavage system aminomethyltransferase T
LKEVLEGRGQILAVQYQHGEDAFEIWVKSKKEKEVFMFMLFSAGWMVIEV